MIWMWGIAANLISQWGFFDIAVRDIEISKGAFALAALSAVRSAAAGRAGQNSRVSIRQRSAA